MKTKNSSSNMYEKLECPDCEAYLEEIQKLHEQCKKLSETLQSVQTNATKMELVLQQNGLMEKLSDISETEAICVEQIRRLKEKSALQPFTETDTKILDVLYRNLKIARGEAVEKDKDRKKLKKLSEKELVLILSDFDKKE